MPSIPATTLVSTDSTVLPNFYVAGSTARENLCLLQGRLLSSLALTSKKNTAPRLQKAPYVCHGCKQKNRCGLTRYEYMPTVAHHQYLELLSESRQGRSYSPEGNRLHPQDREGRSQAGLSPYIIWANHKNELPCSHRTIYRLIQDRALLAEVSALTCPTRSVTGPEERGGSTRLDTRCRQGRTCRLPGLHGGGTLARRRDGHGHRDRGHRSSCPLFPRVLLAPLLYLRERIAGPVRHRLL